MNIRYLSCLLILLLFVTACGESPPSPELVSTPVEGENTPIVEEESPVLAATATPADYPEPEPTVEPENYPAPTETQEEEAAYPGPADCDITVEEQFASLLESQPNVQQTLGCPTAEAFQTNAAWQVFENEHQMVWLESEDAILAMYDGTWHGFEDTFDETTDPEDPPDAPTPPADDRYIATRGFGKVWVDLVDEIGFAVSREEGYEATVQQFDDGWVVSTPFGQVFVLEGMTDTTTGSGPYQAWLERDGSWVSGEEAN